MSFHVHINSVFLQYMSDWALCCFRNNRHNCITKVLNSGRFPWHDTALVTHVLEHMYVYFIWPSWSERMYKRVGELAHHHWFRTFLTDHPGPVAEPIFSCCKWDYWDHTSIKLDSKLELIQKRISTFHHVTYITSSNTWPCKQVATHRCMRLIRAAGRISHWKSGPVSTES